MIDFILNRGPVPQITAELGKKIATILIAQLKYVDISMSTFLQHVQTNNKSSVCVAQPQLIVA